MIWLQRARLLLAGLWAGSLCTVGYLVAPAAFAYYFDSIMAGNIAGLMFRVEGWVSLGMGVLMLALAAPLPAGPRRSIWGLSAAILCCTLLILLVLSPMIAELRQQAGPLGVIGSEGRDQFRLLHGLSSMLWLVQSLLALVLLVKTAESGRA